MARRKRILLIAVAVIAALGVVTLLAAMAWIRTPSFRNWARQYAERQAAPYLQGELSIGRLGGSLFTGVELGDVRLVQNGRDVIAVDRVSVDYAMTSLIGSNIVIDRIRLHHPVIRARETASGWNLANLVRAPEPAAPRPDGADRTFVVLSMELTDAEVFIERPQGDAASVRLPRRLDGLDASLSFRTGPSATSIGITRLSAHAHDPDLIIRALTGGLSFEDDGFTVTDLGVQTNATRVNADVTYHRRSPADAVVARIVAEPVSLPELSPFVPALAGRMLTPHLELAAEGGLDAVEVEASLTDPVAGALQATFVADADGPERGVRGSFVLDGVDLAPLLVDDEWRSAVSATVDVDVHGRGSSLDTLEGRVDVRGQDLAVSGYRVDALDLTADLGGEDIRVNARLRAYAASANASGTVRPRDDAFAYDLRGRVDDLDLSALPRRLGAPALDSRVAGAFDVNGVGTTVAGTFTFGPSTVEGATIADGARGRFGVGDGTTTYAFDGVVSSLDLERVGRALGTVALATPQFASDLNGQLTVDGSGTTVDTLALTASGQLGASQILGAEIHDLMFDAEIAERRLTVTSQGAFGSLDPARATGRAELAGAVAGTFAASAEVSGLGEEIGLDDLAGDGSLELQDSSIGGLAIDMAQVTGTYAKRIAGIDVLTVRGPALELDASGPLVLADTGQSQVKYQLSIGRLTDVGPLVGRELEGRLNANGTITGNRTALRSSGSLEASGLRIDDVLDALALTASYEAGIDDLDRNEVEARIDLESTLLTLAGRELRRMTAEIRYAGSDLTFETTLDEAGRTVNASGRVVLQPDHREVHFSRLGIEAGDVRWGNPEDRELTLRYGVGQLTFDDLRLVDGMQQMIFDGTLALDDTAEGSLDVQLDSVDLASLSAILLLDRQLTGRLDATAHVAGPASGRTVTATLTASEGTVDEFDFDSLEAEVEYAGSRARIDARLVPERGASLDVTGEVPTTADGPIDLHLVSTPLSLGVLRTLTQDLERISGQMQIDIDVTGTGAAPLATGTLIVRDGAFDVVPTGTRYEQLQATILLNGDTAVIDQLQIVDDDGHPLEVSGRLTAERRALRDVDVTARADEFRVLDNDLGDVSLDAELNVQGSLQEPRVGGTLHVHAGRLEVDALLERLTSSTYAAEPTTIDFVGEASDGGNAAVDDEDDGQEDIGLYRALALDITVDVPDNLVLRGTDIRTASSAVALGDMNVTVGGDFTLRKRPGDDLVLLGEVNTVRGTYDFQGRRFSVQRDGSIRFEGTEPIDPSLDLRADRVISGIVAHVNVSGTARDPQLRLSSDPPLDEADILSLIVFNRPANQLGEGERASLGERAASLAGGFVVSPIVESLGDALDLDLFEVETVAENGGGPAVTLGDQVGERLFLRFRQQFGGQDVSEFLLEYRLADVLRLQGSLAEGAGSANRSLTRRVERGGIDLVVVLSY